MKRIDRYVLRSLIRLLFVSTSATFVIVLFLRAREFLFYIIYRDLSVETFLYMLVLLAPSMLLIVLPITTSIAVLQTYSRLTNDREYVIMRASGLSVWRCLRPAIIVALATSLFAFVCSAWLAPVALREFKDQEQAASLALREGQVNAVSEGLTVFVPAGTPGLPREAVIVRDTRNTDIDITVIAQRLEVLKTGDKSWIRLIDGHREERPKGGGDVSVLSFQSYRVEVPEEEQPAWRRESKIERYIHELINPPYETYRDKKNFGKMLAEGHNRIVVPILPLVLTAIGLAVLLTGERGRRNNALRLIAAGGLSIGVVAGHMAALSAIQSSALATPLLYLNALLPLAGAIYFLALLDRHAPGLGWRLDPK
jgi:lipopolysaccharide export system permease protein